MKIKTKFYGKIIFTAIFALVISATGISAATFTVTNTNDTGAGSLRQAVLDANAAETADEIVFDPAVFSSPQTITLATVIQISPAASVDTLTITGPGAHLLTIRSSGAGSVRIFQNGPTGGSADVTSISGITFAESLGGNIANYANLSVSNCAFVNNTTTVIGVGINNSLAASNLTVDNSVFSGNTGGGGSGGSGGAINNNGTLTVTGSTFASNTIGFGGAIANSNRLTIGNSTFTNNTANSGSATSLGGGAIYSNSTTAPVAVTITNSTFTGNVAINGSSGGGAIANRSGTMEITGSTFTNNAGHDGGGAIRNFSELTIDGSSFTGNFASGPNASQVGQGCGGAIYNTFQMTITNSLIAGNRAANHGGGICFLNANSSVPFLTITNTTISGNLANAVTEVSGGVGGGIVVNTPGTTTVTASTIVGNRVNGSGGGGGVYLDGDTLTLQNSIIANNSATSGVDISGGFINSLGYNLIRTTTGTTIAGTTTGNITGVDPLLGPLSFNGGPTRTHALLNGSPAIDAGDPTKFSSTDQRGIARPQDGDGAGGARADIGAYERRLTNEILANNRVDFDGDGKADISIFRPSNGEWWYFRSSDGGNGALQFGTATDNLTPADYTGDGKADIALFRPSDGFWFILRSEDSSFLSFPFGTAGDVAISGDFDADGKTDPTIFRPSTGEWYILKSTGGTLITSFGTAGDLPVVADYDGDGRTDIAIYRPSAGEWWIQRSSNLSVYAFTFGVSTDRPVQGDYSGDGLADPAFWRPSTGEWFILRSENGSFYSVPFGLNGDQPSPGDYDGDGRFDTAVYRPSGSTWYINRSTAGIAIVGFGAANDVSVPYAVVP